MQIQKKIISSNRHYLIFNQISLMAILFPSLPVICRLKVPPTDGELYLCELLKEKLDDNCYVFFNPYLDGDRPNIIVLKKHGLYNRKTKRKGNLRIHIKVAIPYLNTSNMEDFIKRLKSND